MISITIFTILLYAGFQYFNFLSSQKVALRQANYVSHALEMQKRVSEMISSKQKATVAMALSLTNDEKLLQDIQDKNINTTYYNELINTFKQGTDYQNIWIHILDKDLTSLYRSWNSLRGDNISKIREDLVDVLKTKKTTYNISQGKFTISIKAIVPILQNDEIVGILEVISHFNSISKQMKKFDVDSLVVLEKKFTLQLEYPFTNIFIDGYYIANFDASPEILEHLKGHNLQEHILNSYIVDNEYLVSIKKLKTLGGDTLGYYIMFKKITDIPSLHLDFFMFKWLAIALLIVMTIAGIVNIVLFYFLRKQKHYYKKIIDSSTNIVLINNDKHVVDVNRAFFKYFDRYSTVAEFKMEHDCICDYFVEEDPYVKHEMEGEFWIDYLVKNRERAHKVKIKYYEKTYYFLVSASIVSLDDNYTSIVFSEITNEENYKKELELLSITDALTGISNRRYFEQKTKEEISRSIRYEHSLSFIMLDIDHFKKVNDIHGHGVGDSVLIEYVKLISSMLRDGDIFSRIGGEEFMIILPHANKDDATVIADKLRHKVQEYKKILPITMSFGVTEYIKDEDISYILKRIDDALYEAKEAGRNRVVAK